MMEYAGQNIHTQRCLAGKQLNPKQCFCQDETPSPVPQSPTVIANAPCGCKVNGFNDKIGWHMEIAYCPLHAAAPELLAKLRKEHQYAMAHRADYCREADNCLICQLMIRAEGNEKL